MAIDPNIILGLRPPQQLDNPMDIGMKAMTMKQLSMQTAAQQRELDENAAMKDAYRKNMLTGADGRVSLNQQGMLSDLGNDQRMTNPMKILDLQKTLGTQAFERLKNEHEAASTLIAGIRDPETYKTAVAQGRAMGLSNWDTLPDQYDPKLINKMLVHSQNAEQQIKSQESDRDFGLRKESHDLDKKKYNMEVYKTFGGSPPPGFDSNASAPAPAQRQASYQVPSSLAPNAPNPQALSDVNPAELVRYKVPQHLQSKAFDEIEAAQNTARNYKSIMDAFDKAYDWHAADVVPFHQNAHQDAVQALLGPTFKDVEGTVRQAAMDLMYSKVTPRFGDTPERRAIKRATLEDYLKSKMASPTNKGFGIDLSKHQSTNPDLNDASSAFTHVIDPSGVMRVIPASDLPAALQAGGRAVGPKVAKD